MPKYVPKIDDKVKVTAMARNSAWYGYVKDFYNKVGTLIVVERSYGHYGNIGYYFAEIKYSENIGPYDYKEPFIVGNVRLVKEE